MGKVEQRARECVAAWLGDRVRLASVVAALSMWCVMALAESRNAPTSDEYWHVTRGVAALRAPDTRINHPHPPFAQALAMLPVSLTTKPDFAAMPGFATASMPRTSSSFIKRNYAEGRKYLRAGRLMNAALAAALLVFLVAWLRRRFDDVTALGAGLLYATCPIILAHGGLVTNDFGLGAATLLGFAGVYGYLEGGGVRRLLLAAFAAALLPIVKVSGLLVFVTLAVMPLVWFARRSGPYADGSWGRATLRLLRDYAVVALVTLFAINAVYRFHLTGLTPRELSMVGFPNPLAPGESGLSVLSHWPASWPVPLPYTYLRCAEFLNYKDTSGHASLWFGKYSRSGSPYYFPFMLLGKTQALLLPLVFAGFVLGARKMLKGAGKWLALIALLFLAAAIRSKLNIGVRHVMPSLVCLLVLGGRALEIVLSAAARLVPRLGQALAALTALSLISGVAWAFPAFIGDFNVVIGNELGRRASPIAEDWGQDGAGLSRELKKRGLHSVAYVRRHSYNTLDLENEGLEVQKLGCRGKAPAGADALAIHLTPWARNRRCYKQLRKREPDFVVNHNVFVFLTHERGGRKSERRRRHPAAAASEAAELRSPPEDAESAQNEGAGGSPDE